MQKGSLQQKFSEEQGVEAIKRRSRFRREQAAGMRLEPRDEQLLCDLFLQRAMSRSHIEEMFFSSTGRCNARLRQLFDHGFVERYYPPAAPYGAQAIYSTGKAALPLVSQRLEMDLPEVTRFYRRGKTPTFVEHTLAIVDVWLAFRRAVSEHPRVQIERWVPELLCHHEWEIRAASGGGWRKEAFRPDGFIRLSEGEQYHSFFLEVDRGHTSSRQFASKIATHARYRASGLFTQTYGDESFHTLIVTTGPKRLTNLLSTSLEAGIDFLRLSHDEVLRQSGVLEPVWWTSLSADPGFLLKSMGSRCNI